MWNALRIDKGISHGLFGLMILVLTGAPWLFGAWESWYFWPFAGLIFLATAGLGLRFMLSARIGVKRLSLTSEFGRLVLLWLPFLVYAIIRGVQAPVVMDAERSVLLHVTAFMVAMVVLFGLEEGHRRWLAWLLTLNFLLLGVYGIGNHFLAGNAKVLWAPGFPQYQQGYFRATGSYYCPDHFAGLMELGVCVACAVFLHRDSSWRRRVAMLVLACVMGAGILLSKSRGGGIVLLIVLGSALCWGLASWPGRQRWLIRLAFAALGIVAAVVILMAGTRYMHRFMQYPWRQLEHSDRYQMTAAALRGWKLAPVFGVGPGMHQNIWPHIAASADGDRAKRIWPRFLNNHFHSYEAHNDWAQLLEEYGAAGLALFLLGTGATWLRVRRRMLNAEPAAVAAGLAGVAMAVHSVGDFNLQIPATVWLLASMVAVGLASGDILRHSKECRYEGGGM